MTNKRITELTALDGDDVADNDVLAIVDVSDTTMAASGTTKKITVAELVTDSALTNKFWPNSTTALTGANLANGDKLAVVDVGSPDVAKYITADELAQGSQFSSRYKPLASDRLWVSASQLTAVFNSPTLGTLGNAGSAAARQPVMLFDASTAELASSTIVVPPSWNSFTPYLWWSNAGAGSGDVRWVFYYEPIADGGTSDDVVGDFGLAATAAPAQYVVKRSAFSAVSVTAGDLVRVGIYRWATELVDTLSNDVGVLGMELVRAS